MASPGQDYLSPQTIRAAAILTTGYVAATVLDTQAKFNQLVIYNAFTIGSLTTAELKVDFSHDGTTWYQETFQAISSGTATETLGEHQWNASGNRRILVPLKDRYVRVSVKGTGTVTNSSMEVLAILGNA